MYKRAILLIVTGMAFNAAAALPPKIKEQKENLKLLFKMAESGKYKVNWYNHINSGEKRIRAITLFDKVGKVDGEKVIPLSPEMVRVWSFFKQYRVFGRNLTKLEVYYQTPVKTEKGDDWHHDDKSIVGKRHKMVVPYKKYNGYKLILKGHGTVKKIDLYKPQGISPEFDDRAWLVLGGDKPVMPVKVKLYANIRRSIDGVTTYEEDKFRRVSASVDGPPEAWKTLKHYQKQGFQPGRQMIKFGPLLEKAHGDKRAPKLKEDPNKPGWSDYSFFDKYYKPNRNVQARLKKSYPENFEYIQCLNNWPTWIQPKGLNIRNEKGTPAIELFDSAADLAGRFVEARKRRQGFIAKYWEVKNESSVKSEWMYHWEDDYDAWGLLAEFHNKVADAIKKRVPEVKVGGPTSAWMALEAGGKDGFEQAREQLRFMDLTRDHLDFYSHHFYESKDLIINDPARDGNYGGYLSGRLEADLDLLRNHMLLTNNLKPLIISETGTLHNGPSTVDHWIKLKNYNSYIVRYMNRANEFSLVVPFILPITWWDRKAPNNLFRYTKNGIEKTPQYLYIDFWENYKGDLAVVETDSPRIFMHAVVKENVVQLVINNMNPQRVKVDVRANFGSAKVKDIEQRRLWLDRGKLRFDNVKLKSLKAIPLSVEETCIVKITLDKAPRTAGTLIEKTFYGDKTLLPTGKPAIFNIKAPQKNIKSAVLRVSFGRKNGFNKDMTVVFNGKKYTGDLKYTDKKGRFFGYTDFNIPANMVKLNNTVSVNIPQAGGKVSTVALITKSLK